MPALDCKGQPIREGDYVWARMATEVGYKTMKTRVTASNAKWFVVHSLSKKYAQAVEPHEVLKCEPEELI